MLRDNWKVTRNGLTEWVWLHVAYPVAEYLARLGIMKSLKVWTLIYELSPGLAGLTAFMDAASTPTARFIWWWPGSSDECDGIDTLLADVSEVIERAATPGGLDTYWIEVERLSALSSDRNGVDEATIDTTIGERQILERYTCKGDRYHDWKNGQGKLVVRELLYRARPTPELPVTIVRVTVNGDLVSSAVRRWH